MLITLRFYSQRPFFVTAFPAGKAWPGRLLRSLRRGGLRTARGKRPPTAEINGLLSSNPNLSKKGCPIIQSTKSKGRCAITRILLFLISYGILVISTTHIILFLNYRTIGYEWKQVFHFIIRTPDFAMCILSAITLILTVVVRAPSHPPFSEE